MKLIVVCLLILLVFAEPADSKIKA